MREGILKSRENLWSRILLLSFFILMVNFWTIHHLGNKAVQLIIANGPLLLITIYNSFYQLLKKQEIFNIKDKIRSWLLFFLKPPVLIVLYILFFIAGSLVSSVSVMSSGAADKMTVALNPEGPHQQKQTRTQTIIFPEEQSKIKPENKELNGPNDVVRFIKCTTPFGRPFYLQVEKYVRYSFDLYPWVGKKIRVTKDLTIAPSILIRVPDAARMHLEKGKIVVLYKGSITAETKTEEHLGSMLVGHYLLSPNEINEFIERWKMELLGSNITGPPAARCLLAWQQPKEVIPSIALIPGMTLEAKFFIEKEKPIAKAKFRVGSEKIQDVLLSMERR